MKATINAVCYKSKRLKNGKNPIMLRISKKRNGRFSPALHQYSYQTIRPLRQFKSTHEYKQ